MKKVGFICSLLILIACGNKETVIEEIPFDFGINNAEQIWLHKMEL